MSRRPAIPDVIAASLIVNGHSYRVCPDRDVLRLAPSLTCSGALVRVHWMPRCSRSSKGN